MKGKDMKHTIIISIFLLALTSISQSQEIALASNDTTPFYRMSLEELMNVNVTVASQLPMTNRESPGIVTIITQDEIQKSGASDLMGVIKNVPGFNFSVDVEGVVGIGVRGNWANEGKVLLLYDGIELNEDLYSTLQFGGHYSIDRIKRIEIIRGPGSAIYGGNAEYAVINIITDNNSDFNGIFASANNSMMSKTFGSRGISLATGKSFGSAHINLSTSFNQLNRSQEKYTDFMGNSYDMTEQSGTSDEKYRLDFFFKGFSLTGLYNSYSVEQRDGYDEIYLRAYESEFNAGYITAKYEIKSGKKFVITPGIRFKFQQPWYYTKGITDDV
jgi:outer membrane receptor for ferrienterochelin and colicin